MTDEEKIKNKEEKAKAGIASLAAELLG